MFGSRCTPELRHNRGGLILPASADWMITSGDPHGGSSDPERIGSHEALKAFMISAGDLDHERHGQLVVGGTRSPRDARRGLLGGLSGRATTGRRMPGKASGGPSSVDCCRGAAVLPRGGASGRVASTVLERLQGGVDLGVALLILHGAQEGGDVRGGHGH